jgi:hypothetical protein
MLGTGLAQGPDAHPTRDQCALLNPGDVLAANGPGPKRLLAP